MKQNKKYIFIESLKEASNLLQDLQTFDPIVFDDAVSFDRNKSGKPSKPNATNIFLFLSVIHTEIKNLCLLRSWVSGQRPQTSQLRNKQLGEYNGLSNYLFRMTVATVFELLKFLQKSKKILNDRTFLEICKLIPKYHRNSWDNLINIAMGIDVRGNPFEVLKNIRNQVSFHYDPIETAKGYKARFSNINSDDDRPFISLGNQQISTRFYFADALLESYINLQLGDKQMAELNNRLDDILDDINSALFSLIKSFIQKRSAWRSYK